MKKYKWILIITIGVLSFSVSAWYINYQGGQTPPAKLADETPAAFVLTQDVADLLKKVSEAHLKLNHYQVTNITEKVASNQGEEYEETIDTMIFSRSDKYLKVVQGELIKVQNEKMNLLMIPEEELIVLQDPDFRILELNKGFDIQAIMGNMGQVYTSAKLENLPDGEYKLSLEAEDGGSIVYFVNKKDYLLHKTVVNRMELDEDDEEVNTTTTSKLSYEFFDKKKAKTLFNLDTYIERAGKQLYKPKKAFENYTVHNNTSEYLRNH
jgi:uncharacterized protein YlaN (UPF0358 family)